ncbi:GNAT family acetyltransferase [[Clostridium] sordellii]|uniref:Acetyltransferase, gnat family n=1 Tax=Paraclostridium sordellii TaxID=1505 RepID=A0ABM9RP24_PARSO|nr:N-acetyltransferase [Paeniclostridium sordellii]EPZ54057.1 acetyltransferase family protein [[Clostridium] sordellii ATCC 9714] [Paeniclostridium sordellii ATCC 9714]CEJ73796.1 acetyltransferase, gnat family [[Clostridium] sordellii] [Paeniclostridium sordellii]CEN69344.1 GNAT family acetyltransferase [[Clostridium] sordellii] [Paeniclostridium sordellii]CEN72612.1 GNAT family acetyltransferase [[Clostridium] sordellii] [Paeniclostridium sordellii]CEO24258.1 GNAT family acetyltransferase [[
MNIIIRKENIKDKNIIYSLIKEAFKNEIHSDGDEPDLVNRLRNSKNYIPELSLVATFDESIIGYIMFTKILIENEDKESEALALAPLAVLPGYQGKGIGSKLINKGLEIAKNLGYKSVIVLGSETYYPKFGFKEALCFGIKAPFEVPSPNFMSIELEESALKDVSGTVVYAKEFFEK